MSEDEVEDADHDQQPDDENDTDNPQQCSDHDDSLPRPDRSVAALAIFGP
jgi:hypothetical protein